MWSSKITWQNKIITSPLPRCLWPPNWWRPILRHSYLKIDMALESRGLARSHDKLKPLYLQYHRFWRNKPWQTGDLPWGAPTYKVTWFLSHIVSWSRDKLKHYIFTTTMPVTKGVGRMVTWVAPIYNFTWSFNHVALCDRMINKICYISTNAIPVDTRHDNMVTYCKRLPPIRSHNPLNNWSYEATWKIK